MRLLRLVVLALLAAVVVLGAVFCGGDGDDGDGGDGDGTELTPGEQELKMSATMEVELLEEAVSATSAPALQSQTVELSGTATINVILGGSAFDIPGFSLSGPITVGGEEAAMALSASAETATTGAVTGPAGTEGVQGWTMDFYFEASVAGRNALTNTATIPMEGTFSAQDGEIETGSLATTSDFSGVDLVDAEGNAGGSVSSAALSFQTTTPDVGAPPAGETINLPEGFQYVGAFGASPEGFQVTTQEDGEGGQLFSDPDSEAGFAQGENDILSVDIARMTISAAAAELLERLYGCETEFDEFLTVCNDPAAAFPSGEVFFISTLLGAEVPVPGNEVLDDHICVYATVFNNAEESNFAAAAPFTEDYYQGSFYWSETIGGNGSPYSESFSTAFPTASPVSEANVRQTIVPRINRVITIVPVDAVPGATRFRAVADCHLASSNPAGSGGDILGELPSTDPLSELPAEGEAMEIGDVPTLWAETGGEAGSVSGDDAPRGDANCDGVVNIADAVWMVNELFLGGPESECPDAVDANEDELYDAGDPVHIVNLSFFVPLEE